MIPIDDVDTASIATQTEPGPCDVRMVVNVDCLQQPIVGCSEGGGFALLKSLLCLYPNKLESMQVIGN